MKPDRTKIYNKYKGHCAYCGSEITLKQMQVDHIIPKRNFINYVENKYKVPEFLKHLTENDLDHEDNLNPACSICNKWKSAMPLELFRSEIKEQLNRLNKYSANYRLAKKFSLIKELDIDIVFYFEKHKD